MSSSSAARTVVNGRLPLIVTPTHYDLTYTQIDLRGFTFAGTVVVSLTACEEVPKDHSSLVLHTRDLQLTSATLVALADNKTYNGTEFKYQLHHQTCEIVFGDDPASDSIWTAEAKYQLTMEFCGILNDQMAGFYRSHYTNLQGQRVTMASTQFEPTDARRAFPCWDEPAVKATFQLTVVLPDHRLQAISNTPVVASHTSVVAGSHQQQLIKTVKFGMTPKMSTYLVALVIGEFDAISTTSPQSQIQTTVYTVPGKATQGQFCLDTAGRCLDFLQSTYGVKYPLLKSDLIAIPDFAAGAMENWGCVTYREAKVLVTAGTSTTAKRGIARTVCHELAHMWFGNLVTPEFWTQLWLKEGVARFMEFVALEELFPEWHPWEEFVQSVYNLALNLDALQSSHPVEVPVTHSDEINEIFDAISYAKGASIIRMLCHYIGKSIFMDGVRLYLQRHAYGNAVSEDFWTALSEVSGKPCVEFMKPWTQVMGFPLLQLLPAADDSKLELKTSRFMVGGTAEDSATTKWPMPVTARVEGSDEIHGPWVLNGPDHDDSVVLLERIQEWSSQGKWFKLNVDQFGFYRVNYTPEQWGRLAAAMDPNHGALSATDRLGLIGDSFAAGKAGYASIVDSLRLVQGFGDHDTAEYVVWQELSSNLSSLASLYRSESFFPHFQEYLRRLFSKQAGILGWEASPNESGRTGTLRGSVLALMGTANDASVKEEAYNKFMVLTRMTSLEGAVAGDIQQVLFRLALKHDEAAVFPALKRVLEEHPGLSPETQRDCLIVMGSVKDEKRHAEMLDYIFFSGKVRQQDMAFPLSALAGTSDEGGRATWKFFVCNFEKLHTKLGTGFLWRDCVGLCSRGLRTEAEAQEVEAFFNDPKHPAGSGARRLQQALEVVRTQAARIERDRAALSSFFKEA